MRGGTARSWVANALVVLALVIGAFWLLRGIFSAVAWLFGLAALIFVVGGLLYLASRIRRG